MPLFKSRPDVETDNHRRSPTSPNRKGSIFSPRRGRSLSPTSTSRSQHSGGSHHSGSPRTNGPTRRGFFRRRSSSMSSDSSARRSRNGLPSKGGFFGMGQTGSHDPSIVAARQKVTEAEEAESQADRALEQARGMVREAREHVKILEREAVEDARRAKAKQAEAKIVSKSARGLGRHG